MKTSVSILVKTFVLSVTLASTLSAHSAGYVKFEGVDGESKIAPEQPASKKQYQQSREGRAMLLPAVQAVREAAKTKKKPKGSDHSAGDEHEITYDIAAGV